METEEDNYYDIEKWLCLDKELSYCICYYLHINKNKNIHLRIYK
jgi:hypothetical protein